MHERFIARQPIFDQRLKLFAYELLFRSSSKNQFESHPNASNTVIVESTMLFDLQSLIGHAKAFINADEEALTKGAIRLLPPDKVIVEILESVNPSPEVVQACQQLKNDGYVFALDDFVDHPKWTPLIGLASYIKVDFLATSLDSRRTIAQRYRHKTMELIAEKVETNDDVATARSLGYTFFQGYFFAKPSMAQTRDIPGNKLNYVRLLQAVSARELDFELLESILKQEPSLVYKLLRHLNSPLLGLRTEISSIRVGIQLLGETEFRRWVSVVAVVAMSGDKPPELIRTALTRAFFCEELSVPSGLTQSKSDLFLMGLLSVADALLDRNIGDILSLLPVSTDVRTALCGGTNSLRNVYDTMLSYERADWATLSAATQRMATIEAQIPACYMAAANRAGAVAM